MCGRYVLKANLAEICALFGLLTGLEPFQPRYNAGPDMRLPIIIRNRLGEARWGWPAPAMGIKPIINIRSETAGAKPLFMRDWQAGHRCLVPASGFYEWDGSGQPFFAGAPEAPLIGFCGLWTRDETDAPRFAILTREALPHLAPIHPRMPLIATPDTANAWLAEGTIPNPPALEVYPVSHSVNTISNDNPGLLDRLSAAPQGTLFAAG
jgi:putative SOS response-associated peptidase YedK